MNGSTTTDKLGLGPEVRELKFGQSFNGKGNSFHTIRYDFKPASVDTSKMATLDVGPNHQVTISIPHSDGAGTNVFKGPRKPYAKECVLIVDHVTGEVVLEKLTHTIQVKKTRPERPEGTSRGAAQKPTPLPLMPPDFNKKPNNLPVSLPSSHNSNSSDKRFNKSPKDNGKIKKLMPIGTSNSLSPSNANPHRSNSPMISVPPRHSPLGPSPGHSSPANGNTLGNSSASAFDALISKQKPHKPSAMPSLPCIEDLLSYSDPPPQSSNNNGFKGKALAQLPPPPPPVVKPHSLHSQTVAKNAPLPSTSSKSTPIAAGVLSDSSSGEDSSSSSSSEASDDDSSDGEMEVVPDEVGMISPPAPSMPAVFDNAPMARTLTKQPLSTTSHLLCEDLQLSESGSDSSSDD